MYTMNRDALELIQALQHLDQERNTLNLADQDLANATFDINNYAAEWGCEPTFEDVDHSMEQRGESYMWKVAEALGVEWEEACRAYTTVTNRGSVQAIMDQYTVRNIRTLLSLSDQHYTIRNITKPVWALRLWKHRNPEASMVEQIFQMEQVK